MLDNGHRLFRIDGKVTSHWTEQNVNDSDLFQLTTAEFMSQIAEVANADVINNDRKDGIRSPFFSFAGIVEGFNTEDRDSPDFILTRVCYDERA